MVDHAWVQENLDTYLASDLTTKERENVERHVAGCEACTQALAEARRLEQMMNRLFADARPDANLDDRIIRDLLKEPARALQRPTLWRFAAAAAAVLVVGMVGAVVQAISTEGGLAFEQMQKDPVLEGGRIVVQNGSSLVAEFEKEIAEGKLKASDVIEFAQSAQKIQEAGFGEKVAEDSGKPSDKNAPAPSGVFSPDGRYLASGKPGDKKAPSGNSHLLSGDLSRPYDGDDKSMLKFDDTEKRKDLLMRFYGRTESDKSGKDVARDDKDLATNFYKPTEELTKALKTIRDLDKDTREKPADDGTGKVKMTDKPGIDDPTKSKGLRLPGDNNLLPAPLPGFYGPPTQSPPPAGFPGYGTTTQPTTTQPTTTAGTSSAPYYLQPSVPPPVPATGPKGDSSGKKDPPKGEEPSNRDTKAGGEEKPRDLEGKKQPVPPPEKKQPLVDPPIEMNRKIIRTGEMEFEIDSFDKAVDNVTRLITGVKGGFIATINSDKLPNGKMRGAVVVRMPPQFLDKFVLDLRRELAKSGELKNQRIISLDVTKQYTDIESRLRAARTMEERLIQIIKIGKGEIKDLVAAERELGVWRTKIEEMEGEIRYYANQVSLSTLTISLAEKEILAPTAVVVTEYVRMRLEVDDVAKAHQTAMNAVEEVKGRLTKSELKQHSAGQLQSIICAEIPPAQKDAFRDKLKKLGIVSSHEENQSQHTEGGSGRAAQLKPRQDDVHFDVTMHNTANVRPRLSADLKIATTDVPGSYAKILDEINRAKGQVRDGKLNEQDKLNITAHIDFNVPSAEKQAVDKVLSEIGPVLERINVRAPVSELSTDRKFGYTVLLRDFASIPPSKAVVETIATLDVPATYAKLLEAIAKAKGQVNDAKLNEQEKLNVNAQIDFSVPSEEKPAIDKLLAAIGTSLSRTNAQAPMKQLSTAKKFGYLVFLRDFASIPPNKAIVEIIATQDVQAGYAKLQEAVGKSKAQVVTANLNEQDKLNINAQIDFTVLIEEKPAIDKLLVELGTSLSRTNVQAPMNQLSTAKKFGYTVVLRDFASIPPSKATELKVAVTDVPASYARFVEAIAKAKGQVTDAKLNEKDKLHITAQLVFTVPSEGKAAIDSLLKEIGTVLSSNNVQAAVNQLSTAKKFGYSLDLRDFATIPPSQASVVTIAASKVPDNYTKLMEAIVRAKGQVRDAKLNEQDRLNITGQIDFTVPSDQQQTIEKLLAEIGTILSRNNVQAPVTELSTDRKFGYSVVLRDFANIPPRETFILQIAMHDVPASFREFQETVAQAKGWVNVGKLVEDNKAKIEAQIDFDVPAAEKAAIEKILAKAGAVVSRTSSQVPVNDLATDQKVGYRLSLRSTASIPPREKTLIKFEVADVDGKTTELKELVLAGKGRLIDSNIDRHENGQVSAALVFEVPFAAQDTLIRQMKGTAGKLLSQRSTRDPKVQENELTTAHIIVTLTGANLIVPNDEGVASYVRTSLYLSFKILAIIVMTIVVGLSALVPCVIMIWIGFKLYAIMAGASPGRSTLPSLAPAGGGSKLIAEEDKGSEGEPTPKS
jgi:hypothetical protein